MAKIEADLRWRLCRSNKLLAIVILIAIPTIRSEDIKHESYSGESVNYTVMSVSRQGNDTTACWKGSIPCRSIEFAMSKIDLNYTKIVLHEGVHNLSKVVQTKRVTHFWLEGIARPTIKCNSSNAGLYFGFSKELIIHNIDIHDCGAEFPSTNFDNLRGTAASFKTWNMSTAFHVEETKSVHMDAVHIHRSSGYGAVFYDVVGNVTLNKVTFSDNLLANPSGDLGFSSGGGIYIEFRPKCQRPENLHFLNSGGRYLFHHCKFFNNTAEYSVSAVSYSNCKQFVSFGRGGGISFFSRGNTSANGLTIINSEFTRNQALWGGGVYAEFDDTTGGNSIVIKGAKFIENNVSLAGGGVRVGLNSDQSNGGNTVIINDTVFHKNYALSGGGFSEYRLTGNGKEVDKITMNNCSFSANTADRAGAILLVLCQAELTNINISGHTQLLHAGFDQGEGAIYSYSSIVGFLGRNFFKGNDFSATIFESSIITNSGNLFFENNNGRDGGGMAFYGDTILQMVSGSTMSFENNTATKRGGAIYIEMPVSSQIPMDSTELKMHSCFFLFDDVDPNKSNTSTYFIGNSAPDTWGSNIYADTISMCRQDNEPIYNNSALKWSVFHYADSKYIDGRTTVVTNPIKISNISTNEWNVYPGLPFSPTVVFKDENCNSVYGNIRIMVIPEKTGQVKMLGPGLFLVKDRIDNIKFTGLSSERYSVKIETTSGPPVSKMIHGLELKRCPLGFYLNKDKGVCQCLSEKFDLKLGVTRCDSSSSIYILRGRWGDPVMSDDNRNMEFASHICPKNYCNTTIGNNKNDKNVIDRKFDPLHQCTEGRKMDSPLCGECQEGLGVYFGAESCHKCKNDFGIFWLLLLITFLTALMLLIMLFNADTYATSLNALIYSYQVIPLCTHGNTTLDIFMKFFIGLATLSGSGSVGVGVCLWKTMNDLEKMFLNYLIPFYMMMFIGIMTKLSYRFNNKCFLNDDTVFKSFVFISVIAYSDFTRITFDLLHPVKIRGKWVVYNAGFAEFFQDEHLPFAIIAVLVGLFIVIGFPFIIAFYYLVVARPAFNRLRSIFDTFKRPFRMMGSPDFFSIFYFFNRFALLLVFVYVPPGATQDTLLAILSVIILLIFVYFQPYTEPSMNLYDTLLLGNITLLAIINVGLDGAYAERLGLQQTAHVLTYVPLFCALVKLTIWGYKKYQERRGRQDDPQRPLQVPFLVQEHEFDDGN